MNTGNMDIRAFPIDEPKGSTLAYASIAVDNVAAIRGIRVINGKKGIFVTMPQSQDRNGEYHDLAYPLSKELRGIINAAILSEYDRQAKMPPEQRGYPKQEPENPGRRIDVKLSAKVFPVKEPKNETIAFASIGLDDAIVIRGIRINKTEDGESVVMPQSKDKDGKLRDIAFPLSQELRIKINKAILGEFREKIAQHEQSLEARLAEGADKAVQLAQTAMPQPAMAKSSPANASPGLGD